MSAERSRKAMSTFRERLGETAFAEYMQKLRAKRTNFGRFRLEYVDAEGRTGSQLAAEAGRLGGKARASKQIREV